MVYRDWKCPECKHVLFDIPDNTGPHTCPKDGHTLEKVIAAPSVMFKGSGWTPTFHKTGEKEK